jgi:hypothetical protein
MGIQEQRVKQQGVAKQRVQNEDLGKDIVGPLSKFCRSNNCASPSQKLFKNRIQAAGLFPAAAGSKENSAAGLGSLTKKR